MFTKKERILGLVTLSIGILTIVAASFLPKSTLANDPGPKIFPIFGAILMIGGSVFTIAHKPKTTRKPLFTTAQWKRVWTLFSLFVVYAIGLWVFGFIIATVVILFVLSKLFSDSSSTAGSIIKRVLFSVIMTVAVYLLMEKGLLVLLPKGLLF